MKVYHTSEIRNVALAGHSHAGKTSLAEAMLWVTKQSERLGKSDEGNTVSDYDPEEARRHSSIQMSLLPFEYTKCKVNLLDLPGARDFIGEIERSLRASDGMVLVTDQAGGLETGAEFAWGCAHEFNRARVIFVNKLDKEHASFDRALTALQEGFDLRLIPMTLPVNEGPGLEGVIDLIRMKLVKEDGQNVTYEEIPDAYKQAAKEAHAAMVEAAAEGDDELTMKFLEEETLSEDEIHKGLREVVLECRFVPVFCGSATELKGIRPLLDFIVDGMPDPLGPDGYAYHVGDSEEDEVMKVTEDGSPVLYVFKTAVDPFAGKLSFFKVLHGQFKGDCQMDNVNQNKVEKMGKPLVCHGKQTEQVDCIVAGDIGAVAKLDLTHTTDTLVAHGEPPIKVSPIKLPQPTTFRHVVAHSRSDEDKLGEAFRKLIEQDPTLNLYRDPQLEQTILSGMGETHLEVAIHRLQDVAKIEVDLEIPDVPYRETITRKGEGQGKYKKQTGGHGQYGDCWIRFEPLPEGSGFEFGWEVVGGVVPTNFKPAVEKGLRDVLQRGVLSGKETVDFKAVCYDGSSHSVDSSEMSFKMAASLAFRSVIPKCGPIILEPIYKVKITIPDEYMGDVMGDLNSRRGRIEGMDQVGSKQVITVQVPLSEMYTYGRTINSLSQGRGYFEMEFDHYERVPNDVQEKIIDETRRKREGEAVSV